jgi:hypothetical protein
VVEGSSLLNNEWLHHDVFVLGAVQTELLGFVTVEENIDHDISVFTTRIRWLFTRWTVAPTAHRPYAGN